MDFILYLVSHPLLITKDQEQTKQNWFVVAGNGEWSEVKNMKITQLWIKWFYCWSWITRVWIKLLPIFILVNDVLNPLFYIWLRIENLLCKLFKTKLLSNSLFVRMWHTLLNSYKVWKKSHTVDTNRHFKIKSTKEKTNQATVRNLT